MTIDEAIECLETMRNTNLNYYSPKRKSALSLGIEALKVIKLNRPDGYIYSGHLLPGETKE